MSITKIAADGKATITTKVVSETHLECRFAVRQNESSGTRYQVVSTVDFTDVTAEEMMALASRTIVIDAQRQFRVLAAENLNEATKPDAWAKISVREFLDRDRKDVDPKTRALNAMKKLSPEERAAILKLLGTK